ncbi:hypothetical protein CkaCkLH20_09849 [Colletotrichum karsti]|uniref:Uncharacterized protein n=1 Tax=Colletotrichum karsti TaxID=1095194 RepID=A0A9P6LHJ3_9PEZI|nr:uncharacterized protein CkaCkLH20_09849 [Colletotrichum karsti]KAF9872670.1 hypothetical protein CkaCkLH20_09849 [Colletotrichum karsti]
MENIESSRTTQRAAANSVVLKNNPFILADKMTKVTAVEPKITDVTARGGNPARLSDCVPKQTDLAVSETHGDCGNPRCNATHAGHHSGRHSIACIVDHGATETQVESNGIWTHPPLEDPIQGKIDKMYHHAEDLRRTQHIMEHLAAGSVATNERSRDHITTMTEVPASHTSNSERLISFDTAIAAHTKSGREMHLREWERSQSVNVDPVKKRSSDSPPSSPDTRLQTPPEWLSPKQTSEVTRSRVVVTETENAEQTEQSKQSLVSNESSIEWPTLRKVTKETVMETEKAPLPWMQRPLRRVQKEEDISQHAQAQKSAEVESWRSQLRKVTTEAGHNEASHHGHRERAETCTTCHDGTPSPSSAGETIDTESEKQNEGFPNLARSKQLEEVRVSTSRNSSSTSTRRVESETVTHVSRTMEETQSASSSHMAEETSTATTSKTFEGMRAESTEVEILNPVPIMPSNHTCVWKERYMDLTAEVRHLKAEIVSRERIGLSLADAGITINQDDDDLGVEGLTIVMHLKGKDDLVINTDLTRASSDV